MKRISIVYVLAALILSAFTPASLPGMEIKIGDYTITVTPALYRVGEKNETPYKTIRLTEDDDLILRETDFEDSGVFGFRMECTPRASGSAWRVKKEDIKMPDGLEIVRPSGKSMDFRFLNSIRFKATQGKEIRGTIEWMLKKKDLELQKMISIPISIIPKPDTGALKENLKQKDELLKKKDELINDLEQRISALEKRIENLENKLRGNVDTVAEEEYQALVERMVKTIMLPWGGFQPGDGGSARSTKPGKGEEEDVGSTIDVMDLIQNNLTLIFILLILVIISVVVGAAKLWDMLKKFKKKAAPKMTKAMRDVKEMIWSGRQPVVIKTKEKHTATPPAEISPRTGPQPKPRPELKSEPKPQTESKPKPPVQPPRDEEPIPGSDGPDFVFEPRKKEKSTLCRDELYMARRSNREYYRAHLYKMWKDTSVSNVYIHRGCVAEMQICVTRSFVPDRIPETAGFLLGRYAESSDEKGDERYDVMCEVFVPARHIQANEMEVVFTPETFSDLATEMDKYPNLETIGWFHTHPGLGVFLSDRDENIHTNHFPEKWKIAVVADPVNDKIGMFTWDAKGRLNNAQKALNKKDFIDWTRLDGWLKVRE